ncbi:MAG: response regulator transcription factor [Chthoniobacterales bacterium]|nr:response regulator transcription factor [Chthoniobacterales bacterium]
MRPPTHSVLVVDDHPIVRQGVHRLIAGEERFKVCGEASSWSEAIEATATHRPDAVILDISLGKRIGLDLVRELLALCPQLRVLVLSMHDEIIYAERSLRAGAHGYVMKSDATHRVLTALDHILAGGIFLAPRVSGALSPQSPPASAAQFSLPALSSLTNRELEVLSLIGKGLSSEAIATALNLSIKTVETHRGNIRTKFRLESGDRLLEIAIRYTSHLETG